VKIKGTWTDTQRKKGEKKGENDEKGKKNPVTHP
jgi:hypothetical protein